MASHYLIVKTSSLGDVIHAMPAVTEWCMHRPDALIDWVVEEAYAPLVGLHPGVRRVIPVAWRRWRKALARRTTWQEFSLLRRAFGETRYDAVIDAQGLLKSAVIAWLAGDRRIGLDAASAREPLASRFYTQRLCVPWGLHAIDRCRLLLAQAGHYPPGDSLEYGLHLPGPDPGETPRCVLLHGTAVTAKQWPESHWRTLAVELQARGMRIELPHGNAEEEARAHRIATGLPNAFVPNRAPIDVMARRIASAHLVVGVDTGLLHLAAALRVPLVALFVLTDPAATGPRGTGAQVVLGCPGQCPTVAQVLEAMHTVQTRPGMAIPGGSAAADTDEATRAVTP